MASVYELLKKVPRGKVTTYKILADKLGTSPRAVGSMMRANKEPIRIPCHRVIMSNGSIGGYALGVEKKKKLLRSEGIKIENNKIDKKYVVYL